MWPKTTAPRAAETPRRPGVRGQEDTVKGSVRVCGRVKVCQGHGFKEGNLAGYPKREQIHPHILYTQSKPALLTAQLARTLTYCIPPGLASFWYGAS